MYMIERSGSGTLSTMARPRGNDWLVDEINSLREAGTDILVSMLTSDEINELDLQQEPEAAATAGLIFFSCPTPDRGVPDAQRFRDLLRELQVALSRRQNVVVHCRMGIGRSSLVAAGLLIAEGMASAEAWAAVASARGMQVPDTEQQKAWLEAAMSSSP
jgi:protein-tyrosine phosphatase